MRGESRYEVDLDSVDATLLRLELRRFLVGFGSWYMGVTDGEAAMALGVCEGVRADVPRRSWGCSEECKSDVRVLVEEVFLLGLLEIVQRSVGLCSERGEVGAAKGVGRRGVK